MASACPLPADRREQGGAQLDQVGALLGRGARQRVELLQRQHRDREAPDGGEAAQA